MVVYILFTLAFAFYAGMWTIQFHFCKSFFSRLNYRFWNPQLSWMRKWEPGTNYKKERFFGSSTVFVFLTDGFHLLQFFFENLLMLGMSLNQDIRFYYAFLILRAIYAIVFNLLFDKVLIKRNG